MLAAPRRHPRAPAHACVAPDYYLNASGRTVWWKKHITQLQIVQFVTSLLLFCATAFVHASRPAGEGCQGFSVLLYNLVFNSILLSQFFNVLSVNTKRERKAE